MFTKNKRLSGVTKGRFLGGLGKQSWLDKIISGAGEVGRAARDVRSITEGPEPVVATAAPTVNYVPFAIAGVGALVLIYALQKK